jgi:peptide deformylase
MKINKQLRMIQLAHKGILCAESVKAKMNGSYVASLDRFYTKNEGCLTVESLQIYHTCEKILFNPDTLK